MKDVTAEITVGVDIAKDTFEAAFVSARAGTLLRRGSYPNTPAGHRQFVETARSYDRVRVVMEATGTYHLRLSKALTEAELQHSVINPLQAKRFSQMKLRRAKTDKSDAALLACYGREQRPSPTGPPSAAQAKLKQISTLIDQLTKQRTALKNQRHAADQLPDPAGICQEVIDEQLQALDRQLRRLKDEQERLGAEQFAPVKKRIESVIGVGPRTTCTLLAYAGDLSTFDSHKQLSAFMGLDPTVEQSGQSSAAAHISKRGHKKLRTLFYMAAQSARKYNRACRRLYERLRAKGKPKKVALIAVANKLIKQVFAVVKNQTLFDNHYQEKALAT